MRLIFNVAIGLLLSISCFAGAGDLPNFRRVNSNIYRSGRPTQNGLVDAQKNAQIKTIINLEDSMANVKKEQIWASQLAIKFHSFPTSSFRRPSDQSINSISSLLADSTQYPILIHCHHGEDRTGILVGLYRVFEEKWTPEDAYQEMLKLGFHRALVSLDRFFKEKTSYNGLLDAGQVLFTP